MNKTALGFGIGLVLIAAGAVAYLALVGQQPPQPAAAPDKALDAAKLADAAQKPEPEPKAEAPAPEAMPEPPKPPAQPPVAKPTRLVLTRTIPDAAAFKEKEVLDVIIRIEQAEGNDPVRAMGMQEQLPPGYVLDTFDGPRQPDVKPPAGTRGLLEFAWFQFPEGFFPAEFTYRIKKAGDVEGTPEFSGQVLFRTSGNELRSGVVKTLLGDATQPPAEMPAAPAAPAPEAAAPPAQDPSTPKTVDANVALTRSIKGAGYTPGQPVTIEVLLEGNGSTPVSAIAVVETAPPGWTFESVEGANVPPIKPAVGAQGNLSFIFIDVPAFPATFTYTLKPPADATGEQQLKGKVAYRAANAPFEGGELVTPIPQQ